MPAIPTLRFPARPGGGFPPLLTGPDEGDWAYRPSGGPPMLIIRKHADVRAVARNSAAWPMAAVTETGELAGCPLTGAEMQHPDGGFLNMDGPRHQMLRRRLAPLFTRAEAADSRPAARLAARTLAAWLPAGQVVDGRAQFTEPFTRAVVCSEMGIPVGDWPVVSEYARVAFAVVPDHAALPGVVAAWEELYGYWSGPVTRLRARPDGTLTSRIVAALPPQMTVAQVTHVLGTVANGFGAVGPVLAVMLAELAANPRRARSAALMGDWAQLVTALLNDRAQFPVDLPRRSARDTILGGREIPAGTWVLPSLVAAGGLPFGVGPHFCLGAALARMWLATALETLFTAFPDLKLAGALAWEPETLAVPAQIPLSL